MLRRIAALLLSLATLPALGQQVGGYPDAQLPLLGTERLLADQTVAGKTTTVNITPAMIEAYLFPSGAAPVALGGTGVTSLNGLPWFNGQAPVVAATSAQVSSLYPQTGGPPCWLDNSGNCSVPAGSGTVGTSGSPVATNMAAFSNATTIRPALFSDFLTLTTGTCNIGPGYYVATDSTCEPAAGGGTVTGITGSGILSFSGTTGVTTAWAGTSGGIPYFGSSSTLLSSAALGANALVIGGGAGAAPHTLSTTGTSAYVLIGNAVGAPSWGYVNAVTMLGNSVVLPANGGSGVANTGTFTLGQNFTLAGTNALTLTTFGATSVSFPSGNYAVGYLGLPLTGGAQKTTSYTFALADNNTRLQENPATSGVVVTIPANASVPFSVQSAVLVFENVCGSTQSLTIAITADTLYWNPTGTSAQTGSRTLAPCNMATAVKQTATTWLLLPSPGITRGVQLPPPPFVDAANDDEYEGRIYA